MTLLLLTKDRAVRQYDYRWGSGAVRRLQIPESVIALFANGFSEIAELATTGGEAGPFADYRDEPQQRAR